MKTLHNAGFRPGSLLRLSLNSIIILVLLLLNAHLASAQEAKDHLGGYGEITYHGARDGDVPRLDIARFVLSFDHDFSSKWALKSEVELEHVKIQGGLGGELSIEETFLEYHGSDLVGWRGGLVELSIGFLNQTHEPTTFYSVERPLFDREVIPSTWREIGTGIYGNLTPALTYQLYITEGLNTSNITFAGLDGAKQEGSAGAATNDVIAGSDASRPAVSAKLSLTPFVGLLVGVSTYVQRGINQILQGALALGAVDVEYEQGPLRMRVEGALVNTGDAADTASIPTRITGGYAQVGYNIMPLISSAPSELIPFVRYEAFTFETTNSFFGQSSIAHRIVTAGVAFKPVDEVILKADYRWTNTNSALEPSGFSLGAGYSF